MPASTVEEKFKFSEAIKRELPAFVYELGRVDTPTHLKDDRAGVTAYKNTDLLQSIRNISPEHRLEELMNLSLEKGFMGIEEGYSKYLSAAEIQTILQDRDCPTNEQARGLLRFDAACGTLLSKLLKEGSSVVTKKKTVQGTAKYQITRTRDAA